MIRNARDMLDELGSLRAAAKDNDWPEVVTHLNNAADALIEDEYASAENVLEEIVDKARRNAGTGGEALKNLLNDISGTSYEAMEALEFAISARQEWSRD